MPTGLYIMLTVHTHTDTETTQKHNAYTEPTGGGGIKIMT